MNIVTCVINYEHLVMVNCNYDSVCILYDNI